VLFLGSEERRVPSRYASSEVNWRTFSAFLRGFMDVTSDYYCREGLVYIGFVVLGTECCRNGRNGHSFM